MTTQSSAATAFSHVGLCVTDIQASMRFYCQALDFEEDEFVALDNLVNDLVGMPQGAVLDTQKVRLGSFRLELVRFITPPAIVADSPRPINLMGLTHISLLVDDLEASCLRIGKAGGKVLQETKTKFGGGDQPFDVDLIFCLDPDGTRIELYQVHRAPVAD